MGVLLIDSAYMFVPFWMAPPIMSRGFFTKMWGYCGKYWRCLLSGRKTDRGCLLPTRIQFGRCLPPCNPLNIRKIKVKTRAK